MQLIHSCRGDLPAHENDSEKVSLIKKNCPLKGSSYVLTDAYMSVNLFSDLFNNCWRGILGDVRNYLGEIWGGV